MAQVLGRRNRIVGEAARLHRSRDRRLLGRTIIEGPHLLEEALAGGVVPRIAFGLAEDSATGRLSERHGFELIRVDEAALQRVADTRTPRGPVAVIDIPTRARGDGAGLLVAWGVGDPGNVGTLIRTAAAFNWGFGHTSGSADPWSPKVLRSGAGGHFRVGISEVAVLEDIEAQGFIPVSAVVSGGVSPADLDPGRYAVLVGDESAGLPPEVVKGSAIRVTIPMAGGTESLNAAISAAIIVYELSKPERDAGGRV